MLNIRIIRKKSVILSSAFNLANHIYIMRKNIFTAFIPFLAICLIMAGCTVTSVTTMPMAGVLEQPMQPDSIPANVKKAMDNAVKFHSQEIMSDSTNDIAVFSIGEIDQTPSEGFGITVTKGAVTTNFLNIHNSREPQARYNVKTGDLWLTAVAMSGTGVRVEWLYQIRFQDDGKAYIKTEVNPYDVQKKLLRRMGYTIDGEKVTLYDEDRVLSTVTNTVTDMGGFDEEKPFWIGEQLYYDLSGEEPRVVFVPGVKFTTGLALTYDDMPDLSAPFTVDDKGDCKIDEITVQETK